MSEFTNEENQDDEFFGISSAVMNLELSMDTIDKSLDSFIDQEETEEDLKNIFLYCFQLFYRSGRTQVSLTEVHEKINLLIADRALDMLKDADLVEELYDVEKQDYVYTLKEDLK